MYGQFTARPKLWEHHGWITPIVEVSEGVRPDSFFPAPWLPVKRYDKEWEIWITVSAGQVVTLDADNNLVPAGLTSVTYTENDIGETYNITTGALVTADDLTDGTVTYSLCSDGTIQYTSVSPFHVGIAPYDYYSYYGGVIPSQRDDGSWSFECDPNRPRYEKYTNFNPQASVAILTDRYIRITYVGDAETEASYSANARSYAHAYGPIAELADFDAGEDCAGMTASGYFYPGCMVCHDANGMYVPFDADVNTDVDIVGQLLKIDSKYPKNYLERVRMFEAKGNFGTMDQMPGSPTRGNDYAAHIMTDGAYRDAVDNGSPITPAMHTIFFINLILR
jgi:hypothetical protein